MVSIAVWVVVLAGWAGLTYGGVMPDIFLPTPGSVVGAFGRLVGNGTLAQHVGASLEVVLLGFIISSVVAVPLGLMMGAFRVVQAALEPLVNFIRYLPVTSFVPLFILWIGIGIEERVTVIVFGTFFQQLVMIADVTRGGSARPPQRLLHARRLAPRGRAACSRAGVAARHPRYAAHHHGLGVDLPRRRRAGRRLERPRLHISMKAMRGFQVDVIFLAIAIIGILGLITDLVFRLVRHRLASWAE